MAIRIDYENLILDLYLIEQIKIRGNMFVAKIFYLFEEELMKKNIIGSRYKMYKNYYGPYNERIRTHLEALSRSDFLKIEQMYIKKYDAVYDLYQKNDWTKIFLKEIDELIQENSTIFNSFDDIINEFGSYSGQRLTDYVYSLEKTGLRQIRIEEYEMNELVLDPLLLKHPRLMFKLDEDWYDTIEVLLDPKLRTQLNKAIKEVQDGKFVIYNKS